MIEKSENEEKSSHLKSHNLVTNTFWCLLVDFISHKYIFTDTLDKYTIML